MPYIGRSASDLPEFGRKGVVGKHIKEGDGSYTVCLSGVLARGAEQFEPIAHVLPGAVMAYHTVGRLFHVDNLIAEVVDALGEDAQRDGDINIVGASMGGMVTAFVVERFRKEYPDYDVRSRMKVVLVDAPSGADSLANGAAKFLGVPVLGQTIAGAVSLLGVKVPVGDSMLPQWDEITVDPAALDIYDEDDAKLWVRSRAREGLSGHFLGHLFYNTRWMAVVGNDGSLARAARSLWDIPTSYMCCTMGNESPVKQPIAVDWWKKHTQDLDAFEVVATHCGFLQNMLEFEVAFRRVFG